MIIKKTVVIYKYVKKNVMYFLVLSTFLTIHVSSERLMSYQDCNSSVEVRI
jgi:hypothetical protein